MQEESKELDGKKAIYIEAAGKVTKKLRGKKGIVALYNVSGLPATSLSRLEKGKSDPQLTTICRLAHAHGMKCSEFIKLVEDELPEDFSFRSTL